jgi:hypothetical protein
MAFVQKRLNEDEENSLGFNSLQKSQSSIPSGEQTQNQNKTENQFTKSGFNNAGTVLERNKTTDGSAVINRLLNPTQQQVGSQINQIKETGKNYVDQNKKDFEKYKVPENDQNLLMKVERTTQGDDPNGMNVIKTILGRTKGADKIAALNKPQLDSLQLNKNVEARDFSPILSQQAQGEYSKGMNALDSSYLKRSGGAQGIQNKVNEFNSNIQGELESLNPLQENLQREADFLSNEQRSKYSDALESLRKEIEATRDYKNRAFAQEDANKADLVLGNAKTQIEQEIENIYKQKEQEILSDPYFYNADGSVNDGAKSELDRIQNEKLSALIAGPQAFGSVAKSNRGRNDGIGQLGIQGKNIQELLGLPVDFAPDSGEFNYEPKFERNQSSFSDLLSKLNVNKKTIEDNFKHKKKEKTRSAGERLLSKLGLGG